MASICLKGIAHEAQLVGLWELLWVEAEENVCTILKGAP
jgi:hypothetical protein